MIKTIILSLLLTSTVMPKHHHMNKTQCDEVRELLTESVKLGDINEQEAEKIASHLLCTR